MSLTVWEPDSSPDAGDPLQRLSELAGAVLDVAQRLQVTAVAARGGSTAAAGASRSELSAALIGDILARGTIDGHEVARRAAELGCDLTLGAQVLCVELQVPRPAYVVAMIADGCEAALVHTRCGEPGRVYAVLPCTGTCIAGSVGAVRNLARRMAPYGLVGVSSFQAEPSELGRALREAELILELVRSSGQRVAEEIGTGTYRLLVRMLASDSGAMRDFYASTIAPIVDYDSRNHTELVDTLRTYLDCDCNMNTTSATVYAHRHTIASRLERIHALTGLDPLRHQDREQLGLALKVHRLLIPQLKRDLEAGARQLTRDAGAGAPA